MVRSASSSHGSRARRYTYGASAVPTYIAAIAPERFKTASSISLPTHAPRSSMARTSTADHAIHLQARTLGPKVELRVAPGSDLVNNAVGALNEARQAQGGADGHQ